MSSPSPRRRLERRNAVRYIDYDASAASSSSSPAPPELVRVTRSLDLSPNYYSNQTSFRIGGSVEGEVDLICKSLGLSGPEDFAVPAAAWEASRAQRSSSDLLTRSRLSPRPPQESASPAADTAGPQDPPAIDIREHVRRIGGGDGGGIKGARPPALATPEPITTRSAPPTVSVPTVLNPSPSSVLAPPPSILLPELEKVGSTWDLVKSFAPDGEGKKEASLRAFDSGEEERVRLGEETSEDMTSSSNEDDSSSTTTETFVISPNGIFRRNIKSWMRGNLLGSGSFGTVYEGISEDGIFFAVKEVSLLDQGNNAQQCIIQLEQEIALLSQFEHENIVQYYGTDKEEAKLFIFLELVTQGSLASLYQKYRLRDSQVSAYTRQILKGLNYLHERNVVHRDIKCANILVHANGSVKLADFGLAKEMTKINMLKSCKGSVYWMAPEVAHPKKAYGPSADIWSLGCTVLEMLTRQIPYPGLEWQHAFFNIGRGMQPPIPGYLSGDARDFIRRCVQVNPDDRPSASVLLEHPFLRRPLPSLGSGSDYSSSPGKDRWN